MGYPTLAPRDTWYTNGGNAATAAKASITTINIVDSYTLTGKETASWDASADNSEGKVTVYVEGTTLTIAGNGEDKIYANADSSYMFYEFRNLTSITGTDKVDTSNVTTFEKAFMFNCSLKRLDLTKWVTKKVTNLYGMFQCAYSLASLITKGWDTSGVTNMGRFLNCPKNADANTVPNEAMEALDVSHWDVGKVKNFEYAFACLNALTSLDVSRWDVSNVTSMLGTFQNCASLVELDVSKWKTGSVATLEGTFFACYSLAALDVSKWDVSSVTTMRGTFNSCQSLIELDANGWDTSNVTDMSSMFSGCTSLQRLHVQDWNTAKVETMKSMFSSGKSHEQSSMSFSVLDVSNWDVSSCKHFGWMFYAWNTWRYPKEGAILELDLSKWDVSASENFDHMFAWSDLTVDGIENWKAPNNRNFECTFHSLRNYTFDVSGLAEGTENVTTFSGMFKCYNESSVTNPIDPTEYGSRLREIKGLDKFKTSYGIDFATMFLGCKWIEELNLPGFDTTKACDGVKVSTNNTESQTLMQMFQDMPRLRKITLGENFSFNGDGSTSYTEDIFDEDGNLEHPKHIAELPAPDPKYIDGADGKWYVINGNSYSPSEVPKKTANTYYATRSMVEDLDVVVKNKSLLDLGNALREVQGTEAKYKPGEMGNAVRAAGGGSECASKHFVHTFTGDGNTSASFVVPFEPDSIHVSCYDPSVFWSNSY